MGKVNTNESKEKSKGTLLVNKNVNAKRSKKVGKKVCSERLKWNEKAQISMLQGLMDFEDVKKKNAFDDMLETYEFLKDYIVFESYSQEFVEKMMSLKEKLMYHTRKREERSSSERYDHKGSKLMTLVREDDVEHVVEKPKKGKGIAKPKEEKQEAVMVREGEKWFEDASLVREVVSRGGVDEDILKSKWDAVPVEKKSHMDQKWSVLRAKENESLSQKSKFLKELVSIIRGASSSSSSRFM
ncbi:hypothetical protein CARUB_v10016201mg [Capsella rubella]|uniref:Uncharacterized protein n=1 Tax=Capsella rubella TaxID=81985 RepID=R0I4G6_9BRAS|nr:probable transcription factor At4g00232 [Capsella rubella]EOA32885.1 hypothetical protein CARUB_v10016201mg [Capsella rubella]